MPTAVTAPAGGEASSSPSAVMSSAIDQLTGTGTDDPGPQYYDEPEGEQAEPTGEEEPDVDPGSGEEDGEPEQAQEDVDAEIAQIAEEYGIDPETLKGLSMAQIVKKLTESAQQKPEQPSTEINWMDGLEDAAAKPAVEPEAQPDPAAAEAKPDDQPDIGAAWKSQADAVNDMNDAFAEGNWEKVGEIQNAIFKRQMFGMGVPFIQQLVNKAIEDFRGELGDVVPRVRQTIQQQQLNADKDWVLTNIRKDSKKDAALLDAMFKAEDGKEIEFNGQKWPATPYNEILAANPWMLKIRETDDNPRIAQRKTIHARMMAALSRFREMQGGNLKPEKAKELVEAGAQMERRKQDDRVRQGLNAGKGASSTGGKPPRNIVHELNSAPGRGSIEDLMS